MADNTYKFINPYTFLPIKDEAPNRTNLRKGSLSGRIHCKLSIESPTFIPNTSKTFEEKFDKDTLKGQDFFSYQDLSQESKFPLKAPEQPRIPGSEIRGMIRNVYEQLTNSCLSVIDDKNLTHMRISLSKEPGLWNRKENTLIGCERRKISKKEIKENDLKSGAEFSSSKTGYVIVGEKFPKKKSESLFYPKEIYQKFKHNEQEINLYEATYQEIESIPKDSTAACFLIQPKDIVRFEKVLEEYGKKNAHRDYAKAYFNVDKNPILPVF